MSGNLEEQLTMVAEMTERNQEGLRALEEITRQQAHMIDTQSEMMNKMWGEVQPILKQYRRRQEIKDSLLEKFITGGVWGVATGMLFLIWKGVTFMFHQDSGGP